MPSRPNVADGCEMFGNTFIGLEVELGSISARPSPLRPFQLAPPFVLYWPTTLNKPSDVRRDCVTMTWLRAFSGSATTTGLLKSAVAVFWANVLAILLPLVTPPMAVARLGVGAINAAGASRTSISSSRGRTTVMTEARRGPPANRRPPGRLIRKAQRVMTSRSGCFNMMEGTRKTIPEKWNKYSAGEAIAQSMYDDRPHPTVWSIRTLIQDTAPASKTPAETGSFERSGGLASLRRAERPGPAGTALANLTPGPECAQASEVKLSGRGGRTP